MINNPMVSFIVPVYNVEKYLDACMKSLLSQTGATFEIILVDDGATDKSGAMCDIYSESYDNVRVIHQKNQGLSAARNAGLAAARGKWVAYIDSDDWISGDYIQSLQQYIKDEELDCISFGYQEEKPGGTVPHILLDSPTLLTTEEQHRELLIYSSDRFGPGEGYSPGFSFCSAWIKITRREYLIENDIRFTDGLYEDFLFTAKLLHAVPRLMIVPDVLYHYRIQEGSIVRGFSPEAVNKIEPQLCQYIAFLEEHYPNDMQVKQAQSCRIITSFMYCVVKDFCHPANQASYKQRREAFIRLRNQEMYSMAFQNLRVVKNYPFNRLVLAYLVKYRWFWAVDLLNKIRVSLNK